MTMRARVFVGGMVLCGSLLILVPAVTAIAGTLTRATTPFQVRITESKHGYVEAATVAGASCSAQVGLPLGGYRPHRLPSPVIAGPDGTVRWRYATAPSSPGGVGSYTVACSLEGKNATGRAEFALDDDKD